MRVALVTDSTAYLPVELIERYDVRVVALQVLLAGQAFDEDEVAPARVAEALRSGTPVTTSRPSVGAFSAAYQRAVDEGFDAVVSVHMSAEMSGTCASARLAASAAAVPVEVVDSRSLAMGLGFAVLSAGEALRGGAGAIEAARAASVRAANSSACFYVDTLEHLRKGGRIGAASALVGSALAIKPLLRLDDGRIVPMENVRTSVRAIARLEEIAAAWASGSSGSSSGSSSVGSSVGVVDLAVHHLDARQRAVELGERLAARLPGLRELTVSEVGAVVGAHVGAGMLAVVVAPV